MNYRNILLSTLIVISAGYAPATQAMNSAQNHVAQNDARLQNRLQRTLAKYTQEERVHILDYLTTIYGKTRTILHAACLEGYVQLTEFLLTEGVNIEATDYQNATPLDLACFNGHFNIAQLLIKHGATISSSARRELKAYKNNLFKAVIQGAPLDGIALQAVPTDNHYEYLIIKNILSINTVAEVNVEDNEKLGSKYLSITSLPIGTNRSPLKIPYIEKRFWPQIEAEYWPYIDFKEFAEEL